MTLLELLPALIGLGVVTLVARAFFSLSTRELTMPEWLVRGLRYAPLAALASLVLPGVLLTPQGELLDTLADARIYATLAAAAWFWWRGGVLGVIVVGMLVLVPLKLLLGW